MTSYRMKTKLSFGALLALALAAPANGLEAGVPEDAKVDADVDAGETKASDGETGIDAPSPSPAPAATAKELEVTAERVELPLRSPDAESDLPRIDLTDMRPWNWDAHWHASDWANANSSLPWKYDHVRQGFSGRTHLILDAKGAAELKAQRGHPALRNAMYEVDVTIPAMRPGLLAIPLMLWNNDTKESISVEVTGQRGLLMSIHSNETGSQKTETHRLSGDFSGRRMKLAIRRHAELGQIDIFVDGEKAHTFDDQSPAFPVSQLRPIISIHAADLHPWQKNWLGTWQPLARGEKIDMVIHGYRVSTL